MPFYKYFYTPSYKSYSSSSYKSSYSSSSYKSSYSSSYISSSYRNANFYLKISANFYDKSWLFDMLHLHL